MKFKVKNLQGEETGNLVASDYVWAAKPNESLLHQIVVSLQANKRRGTQDTQTRAEVTYSTRKIRSQKGTGSARLGSRRSPNMVGGGVAHGPHPRSYRQRIPKKMKRLALRISLSDKVRSKNLIVIDSLDIDKPDVSKFKNISHKWGITGSTLIITENTNENIVKSVNGLFGVEVLHASLINSLETSSRRNIVITRPAVEKIDSIWSDLKD